MHAHVQEHNCASPCSVACIRLLFNHPDMHKALPLVPQVALPPQKHLPCWRLRSSCPWTSATA